MSIGDTQQAVYELLTSEDDGRVCRDIPEEACEAQPRNFTKHVVSLAATKIGDGLVDPKLVLSWLLTALGAPAFMVGLLLLAGGVFGFLAEAAGAAVVLAVFAALCALAAVTARGLREEQARDT